MFCIDGYTKKGDFIILRDVKTGSSTEVLPEVLYNMFCNNVKFVFKTNKDGRSEFETLFSFASNLFKAKGFSADMLNFNNSVLLLVSPSQYKDFGQSAFLSNFNFAVWSHDMYSVALGDFSNLMRVVDLGIRRDNCVI